MDLYKVKLKNRCQRLCQSTWYWLHFKKKEKSQNLYCKIKSFGKMVTFTWLSLRIDIKDSANPVDFWFNFQSRNRVIICIVRSYYHTNKFMSLCTQFPYWLALDSLNLNIRDKAWTKRMHLCKYCPFSCKGQDFQWSERHAMMRELIKKDNS